MIGIWDLDLDLDMVRKLAWIFPEILISLRLTKAKLELALGLSKSQFSSEKLLAIWLGGWLSFEFIDCSAQLSRSILSQTHSSQ